MDDTLMRVVLLLIDIIGPISIGYFLKQKNLVKPAFNDFMIKLNVRGLFTVLAFVAFWKLKFTAEVALIPIAGLIILFVPYFLGMAITKKVEDPLERGALVVSSMLGNTSTLGGLLCFMLLGATSFAYVQVIGVPDKQYGEEIMACVILKEGETMTEQEMKQYVLDHMAKHKVPRYVDFVDAFPMNAAGKILKYKMREAAVQKLSLQAAEAIETA